ncbi:hypothetical protein [Alloalcanivorax marinus]|uniref:hypothetical protein n=1 Tax=Alloalcanivorax marinus TaxID=1177169 RepID=UPI0019337630|nr:hypothetical protein [Alloalcanivorax marinus]MBL7250215.1 hypothetical protein [Alloalcanivorax marinus]
MKTKLLLSALLGMAAWSFSGVATADWDTGACPGGGSAPCIETEINGNTYHFNGTGGHAGIWHGRPAAEGGGDFDFSGDDVDLSCSAASPNCNLTLSGQVKKCQDSNGAWRIGVKVTGADVSPGDFLCNFITVSGFPWYSKDDSITPHCPFEDDCDSFIPYDANASTYTGNFGNITVDASLVGNLVDAEHVHGVVFTPGVGANFAFASDFYTCSETGNCSITGVLTVDNATSLDVQ